jgi:queuine tRNA-ribosyltransferase
MQGMRDAIAAGQFDVWERQFHDTRALGDIEPI